MGCLYLCQAGAGRCQRTEGFSNDSEQPFQEVNHADPDPSNDKQEQNDRTENHQLKLSISLVIGRR